ncbi:MAG: hypothetical protein ACYC8V_00530, partial [Caulobacteraceae bacterium]
MGHRVSRRAAVGLLAASALPPMAIAAEAPRPADKAFDDLSRRWLDAVARTSPVSATQLGDHRFDAELDDLS